VFIEPVPQGTGSLFMQTLVCSDNVDANIREPNRHTCLFSSLSHSQRLPAPPFAHFAPKKRPSVLLTPDEIIPWKSL